MHQSKLLRSFFFFFSSRRRHTRCSRDWSSDVCSSDLEAARLADQHCRDERDRVTEKKGEGCEVRRVLDGRGEEWVADDLPEVLQTHPRRRIDEVRVLDREDDEPRDRIPRERCEDHEHGQGESKSADVSAAYPLER